MQRSETIGKLAEALSKSQGAIKGAIKDSENPFFKSQYADLASVWNVCREPLSVNGLAVMQFPGWDGDRVTVETVLAHSSGEWVSGIVSAKPVKDDSQSLGSCTSYLRRYSLAGIIGIFQTDDDANAATNPTGKPDLKAPQAKPEASSATATQRRPPAPSALTTGEISALWAASHGAGLSKEGLKSLLQKELNETVTEPKLIPRDHLDRILGVLLEMAQVK